MLNSWNLNLSSRCLFLTLSSTSERFCCIREVNAMRHRLSATDEGGTQRIGLWSYLMFWKVRSQQTLHATVLSVLSCRMACYRTGCSGRPTRVGTSCCRYYLRGRNAHWMRTLTIPQAQICDNFSSEPFTCVVHLWNLSTFQCISLPPNVTQTEQPEYVAESFGRQTEREVDNFEGMAAAVQVRGQAHKSFGHLTTQRFFFLCGCVCVLPP